MAMGCNFMLFPWFIGNAHSSLQWFIRCHWLLEVLDWVSQPWPWRTRIHDFQGLSWHLESDCCTKIAWTCLRLSLNLDRIDALRSSDLIRHTEYLWVCSVRTASAWQAVQYLEKCMFFSFETTVEQKFQDQGRFWEHTPKQATLLAASHSNVLHAEEKTVDYRRTAGTCPEFHASTYQSCFLYVYICM